MSAIVLWAHSRSASTAFLRMMAERGDVSTVHEPLLHLTETGEAKLPGDIVVRDEHDLLARLVSLGRTQHVFVKEVLDYPYQYLFDHPDELAELTHTFIVRDPRQTIASHYAMKNTVTSPEIGYERLYELFELVRAASGREPFVLRAESLVTDAEQVVRAYCDHVGLPFKAEALQWRPGHRPEWERHQDWHADVSRSNGFHDRRNEYVDTVDNNPVLRGFYEHHLPFYERLVAHS
ncbi:sulfotransferase family protein [Actinocrispum wychmicini]|uniref:Sulfotransferase family protein n=1 Tax=Actinocrispum wychmicini TaxID=1213861 RepID=A0A4R2JLE7_9PSEU|nr:sulfotransferase family protein [Actinocrispum wychmicini]TCO60861.1 hypothetical protein EV192_103442 [Actinocrispum wychmicini]